MKVVQVEPSAPPVDGVEHWEAVLVEDEQEVGRIKLSKALGQVFGYDTECHADNPRGAIMLWLAGRRKAREWGASHVIVHEEAGRENPELMEFWKRQGFVPVMTIYRGEI